MDESETTRLRALLERTATRVLTVAEERDAATKRAERAERERDDLAATLETRTAEHALAVEHLAAVTADRDEMAARRDDALADYAAVNEYLAGIVRAWQRAGDEDRRMADVFVPGLRREIEEARDSREGAWWEVSRG